MAQSAHAERIAPVIDLDEWRFSNASPDERAAILRRRGRHEPRPNGWCDLAWIAQTDARDAIRIYARLGLHPIAIHGFDFQGACTCRRPDCSARGKHPVRAGWQAAPFDLEALDSDLVEHPRWNVGLRMGEQPDGSVLLALDEDESGAIERAEATLGTLPATLTARTGSGGRHLIFRVPTGQRSPRNHVRRVPGIDFRAQGAQIVAAPSLHASGRRYEWIEIREPAVLQ